MKKQELIYSKVLRSSYECPTLCVLDIEIESGYATSGANLEDKGNWNDAY